VQMNYDILRWAFSVAIPAIAGFLGVLVGAWLTARRERAQRRLAFIERQLREFYSPLLGIRTEIRAKSELRVRVQSAAQDAWTELCAKADGHAALQDLTDSRGTQFTRVIEYDNKTFESELLPSYKRMVSIFKDNLSLAEPDTRARYATLMEFIDVWERYLDGSLPHEVISRLGHSEENLQPFYKHLQEMHDKLRGLVRTGAT
jgi:superfamily I DNA/RNA helicase